MKKNILITIILLLLCACTEAGVNPIENKEIKPIVLGGEWFINNQNDSFLYYQYNYSSKSHPKKSQRLREMGALWSISKLAHFLNDERYLDLANKGFSFFEDTFEYHQENDYYTVNITPEKLKLGYNAFGILTLLEIQHPKKDEYLKKLANGIIYMQNDDGELRTFFHSSRDTGKDYYPGEALLALMALYEYTKDETYLEVVEKAFPYYVGYFRDNANTAFVTWQTRAYYKLYQATGNEEVAEFIFKMNDFVLEEYNPKAECDQFEFERGIVTAVNTEGVIKAYALANELHDEKRTQCYENFIEEAIAHVLPLQITESTEIEAIGGFLGSETSNSMRVDRNQHAVLMLMDAYEVGLLK